MVTTRLLRRTTESAHLDGEAGIAQMPSVDEQVKLLFYGRKPLTVWEVTAKLGNGYAERASAILDGLTAKGVLARFGAGFNNYYALPKSALTGEEPTLRTVISDSVRNLFLSPQYRVGRKPI